MCPVQFVLRCTGSSPSAELCIGPSEFTQFISESLIYTHLPTFLSSHMTPAGEFISYGSPCRLSSFPCSVHLSPGLSSCAQRLRNFSSKPEAIRFTWSTDVKLQRMARVTGGKVPAERVLKSRGRRRSRHVLGPVMKTT